MPACPILSNGLFARFESAVADPGLRERDAHAF